MERPYIIMGGNSFACAHITGIVANLWYKRIKHNQVLESLKTRAIGHYNILDKPIVKFEYPEIKKLYFFHLIKKCTS